MPRQRFLANSILGESHLMFADGRASREFGSKLELAGAHRSGFECQVLSGSTCVCCSATLLQLSLDVF